MGVYSRREVFAGHSDFHRQAEAAVVRARLVDGGDDSVIVREPHSLCFPRQRERGSIELLLRRTAHARPEVLQDAARDDRLLREKDFDVPREHGEMRMSSRDRLPSTFTAARTGSASARTLSVRLGIFGFENSGQLHYRFAIQVKDIDVLLLEDVFEVTRSSPLFGEPHFGV